MGTTTFKIAPRHKEYSLSVSYYATDAPILVLPLARQLFSFFPTPNLQPIPHSPSPKMAKCEEGYLCGCLRR